MATKVATPVTPTTTLLTIPQVAELLGTAEIHILRLIAREVLPGIRAGRDRKDWKLDSEAINQYLTAGPMDFEALDLSKGGWFSTDKLEAGTPAQYAGFGHEKLYQHKEVFLKHIRKAAYETLPETMPEGFDPRMDRTPPIKADEAMRAVCESEPPKGMVRIQGAPVPVYRFKNLAGYHCAWKLREYAAGIILRQGINKTTSKLQWLYASPEEYKAIVAGAVEKYKAGSLTISKTYGGSGGTTLYYRLPFTEFGVRVGEIANLAF